VIVREWVCRESCAQVVRSLKVDPKFAVATNLNVLGPATGPVCCGKVTDSDFYKLVSLRTTKTESIAQ